MRQKTRYNKHLNIIDLGYQKNMNLKQCHSPGCIFMAQHKIQFSLNEEIYLCSLCMEKLKNIKKYKKGKKLKQTELKEYGQKTE